MVKYSGAFHWIFGWILVICVVSCNKNKGDQDGPQRPHDPWVFRSVLDEQPRMLTLALHDNLWAAYHTDSCALYKVWKGHVHLQGAVYDNAHGPQPISIGDSWIVNRYKQPWSVTSNGQEVLDHVQYAGHALDKGKASIHYKLHLDNGSIIDVREYPEAIINKDGQTGFERVYKVNSLPDGMQISIRQNVNSIALQQNVETNGEWKIGEETKGELKGKQHLSLDGILILNGKGETFFRTFFISIPTIDNPNTTGEDTDELPLGQRLIARNDCKTCHNQKVQTIGPSYEQIARRYPMGQAEITQLTNKIIKGGGGIWGTQVMSPHPELPVADAAEMVRFILSLDTADAGKISEGVETIQLVASAEEISGALPGLLVEAYTNQTGFEKLPVIPASRKPDQAGILTEFQGLDANDFGGLTEDFVIHASGHLFIENDTTVALRVWSDDGSRVTIDQAIVLDNDGMHGTEVKETNLRLLKGFHTILLEYIQGKGGRYLSLEWKPEGAAEWSGLPMSVLMHSPDVHSRIQGKTLSMNTTQHVPGDQAPLVSVHPSYDLSQARPWDFLPKVGGLDFMSNGDLAVCTWDPSGSVYLLSDVQSGDPSKIKVRQIASGLAEPLGLKVIRDTIYIMQKQELTRLIDTDKDGIINEYQCVSNAWPVSANFHEFSFGLAEKNGDLYATLATAIQPGGASSVNQMPGRGHVVKFDLPSGKMEYVASGLRTPNGIGIGADGELFVSDNQGDWLPSSKIVHVNQGDWYGSRSVDFEGTAALKEKPPVVWLPQDEIGNSPSTPLYIQDGPFKGQMIHSEVTQGGVERVFVEKINGAYQGVVFRFIQGLEAGINRMVWGPDGALYVGGIGNPGNWQQTDKLWYGLQRLKYNGKPAFEMLAVRAKTNGIEIEFTEPLREGDGWDPADWEISQWRYVPTADYGGPKIDLRSLPVKAAYVSADRKKVSLTLDGMKAGHVIYIHMKDPYISDSGLPVWTTEAWYTMNQIPEGNPVEVIPVPLYADNVLTPGEEKAGWKLLFDGKTTAGWHNFKKETIGTSWVVSDGALMLDARKNPEGHWQAPDGGDILTQDEYENFELTIEWKIAPCGNSGIIYNVVEDPKYDYVWQTGPEMQVLDNACHPDTRFVTHQAGDLYDLVASSYVTVKPAGEWNKARIIKKDGKVEHWLNGVPVVRYEMYTDEWLEMINRSKFKDMPDFGRAKKGKIALQDHGDKVWYRNIKVRSL